MFRLLARWLKAGKNAPNPDADGDAISLFRLHPIQLHRYLEEVWAVGGFEPYPITGTTLFPYTTLFRFQDRKSVV